jgi:2-polyprenyl-6-methoxyphenol hydroxylase-like FAD-dependent oxidoreductase
VAAQRIAIIGAGIGGLATALALKHSGAEIVIIERDPEPPDIAPEAAFDEWARPGVPQFRHAHILLARVQTLLRDHHPEVLQELFDAGLELSTVQEVLPASQRESFAPMPGDEDLRHLWGRRPTFEYVLRRHVGKLANVRFMHSTRVVGLLMESSEKQLRVHGVELSRDDHHETLDADLVVDASGKSTKAKQWLQDAGVQLAIDSRPSGFVYSCRHYRLKDPKAPMPRLDGGGNLDYLGYATFYAEHGNFALTLGCPVEEEELAETMRRPEGFDAMCEQLPVFKQWTSQAEVKSKVLGAGRFENRWTHYRVRGGKELLGFFAVGDCQLETNPMYGRGCAAAFVQAHVLAEALARSDDPRERARFYYERAHKLLQPYFNVSSDTDHIYRSRARLARGQSIPLRDRIIIYLFDAAWLPAMQQSPLVAREFVKAVQMRELSSVGVRIAMVMQILRAWVRGWFKRDRGAVPPVPRAEFLRRLAAVRRTSGEPSE